MSLGFCCGLQTSCHIFAIPMCLHHSLCVTPLISPSPSLSLSLCVCVCVRVCVDADDHIGVPSKGQSQRVSQQPCIEVWTHTTTHALVHTHAHTHTHTHTTHKHAHTLNTQFSTLGVIFRMAGGGMDTYIHAYKACSTSYVHQLPAAIPVCVAACGLFSNVI